MIQSVDSVKLLNEINKRAAGIEKVQKVLLQINIGKEPQKSGLDLGDVEKVLIHANELQNVKVIGFMCIPPYVDFNKRSTFFRAMKFIFEEMKSKNFSNVDLKVLSMGMSGDYNYALGEGTTMVRIGTFIFGERAY